MQAASALRKVIHAQSLKGEKRPAYAIGNAVMIAKIATGDIEDMTTDDGKNAAAIALGRMAVSLD